MMENLNISQAFEAALPTKKKVRMFSDSQLQQLTKISSIVLAVVAAGGILTLAAVAPNIFVAIDKIVKISKGSRKIWTKEEKKAKIKRAFYYLKQSGMIKLTGSGDVTKVELTQKGKNKFKIIDLESRAIEPQKAWNGRWWLVAADIPTLQYRYAADLFRKKLKDMGFYTLQRTLWFYPFDPQSEVQFIAEHFGIQNYITVMEVARLDMEDERHMKSFFQASGILK